ncbi:PREDICTED: facilitated trehalose transporter Tret1-like [Atta cephalotes]|uniref:Major facilitator superfamily (MFS) profile domain-containing protein n=1 Tax=Atta cephalotes TaxID=12957 RepID=A0A158NZ11_ATTCE|nr:PREDICTED: facilitated trehalose transporter Tret1-like [Atta cephalotes]
MEKCENLKEPVKESGKLRQFLATIIINQLALSYGIVIGWPSPSAQLLQSPSSPVGNPMTDNGVSWLTGILCLSGTFVAVLTSMIPDKFSRKRLGYILVVPIIIAWLLIMFATEHMYIYVSRGLSGISGAATFFVVPNYVSEISCDSIRGMLASILILSVNTGILVAYILGGIMSFRALPVAVIALILLYLITFVFMPESPLYLVRRNRTHEAIRALKWLKAGNNLEAERTLSHIQLQIKETASIKSAKFSDLVRDKATIKGLIIIVGLFIGQQLCGIFAMISNTEMIFKMSDSSLSPNMSSIIVAIIQVFGSWLATLLVERAGRRPLILLSCAGMTVCHCMIGAFYYLQNLQYEVSAYSWIPVVTLSAYMILFSLGMGNGPVVVMSEIFSRDVTSMASAIGISVSWISAFIMTKSFTDFITLLGLHGCFFLLATFCVCNFLFCFILLPETKGQLREDIVDELNGVRCTNKNDIKHIIGSDSVHAAHV